MTFHKYQTLLRPTVDVALPPLYSALPIFWKRHEILQPRASAMADHYCRDRSSPSSSPCSFPYSPASRSTSFSAVQSQDQQSRSRSAQLDWPSRSPFSDVYSQSELSSRDTSVDNVYDSNISDGDSTSLPYTYQNYGEGKVRSFEQYGTAVPYDQPATTTYDDKEMHVDAESWDMAGNAAETTSVFVDSAGNLSGANAAADIWDGSATGGTQNRIDGNCNERPADELSGQQKGSTPADLDLPSRPTLIFPSLCFLDGCRHDYLFPTYQSWRSHIKNVHNKVFSCPEPLCTYEKPFPNKTDLKRHIQAVHKSHKPYRCDKATCPRLVKAWSRKDKLRDHNKKYHSNFRCFFFSHNPNHDRWFDTEEECWQHTISEHPGPSD
jgi:hypothetical protein